MDFLLICVSLQNSRTQFAVGVVSVAGEAPAGRCGDAVWFGEEGDRVSDSTCGFALVSVKDLRVASWRGGAPSLKEDRAALCLRSEGSRIRDGSVLGG